MRPLALAAILVFSGCLPWPSRYSETPETSGTIVRAGVPVAGLEVSVERAGGPDSPECSGERTVQTDARGRFNAEEHKRTNPVTPLLAEHPEFSMRLQICVRESERWETLSRFSVDGWDGPVRARCDLDPAIRLGGERDEVEFDDPGRCAVEQPEARDAAE